MPKKLTDQEKILRILRELPGETRSQIVDVYCADNNKSENELTFEEMQSEIKWSIERLKMDISECSEKDEEKQLNRQLKKVKSVHNKWFK